MNNAKTDEKYNYYASILEDLENEKREFLKEEFDEV